MENTHLLVKHDIKLAKLICALRELEVDANSYLSDNGIVVFDLLGIPKTEQNIEAYFILVESNSALEVSEQANQILKTIKQWKK